MTDKTYNIDIVMKKELNVPQQLNFFIVEISITNLHQ